MWIILKQWIQMGHNFFNGDEWIFYAKRKAKKSNNVVKLICKNIRKS